MNAKQHQITWPFYADDYERDTWHRLRGALEHGAYFLLLKHYWQHGGLPDDDGDLRRVAGLQPHQWQRLKPILQSFFFDGWKHKRVERDLKKAKRFRDKQSGRARVRWENNTGENVTPSKAQSRNTSALLNPLKNKDVRYAGGNASALPILETDRIPSTAARESPAVDKGRPSKQDVSFSKHKPSKQEAKAEQAWGNDLLHSYSAEEYARAIELLAANPDLVAEATRAELKQPGSGHVVAMLGLSVREVGP